MFAINFESDEFLILGFVCIIKMDSNQTKNDERKENNQ